MIQQCVYPDQTEISLSVKPSPGQFRQIFCCRARMKNDGLKDRRQRLRFFFTFKYLITEISRHIYQMHFPRNLQEAENYVHHNMLPLPAESSEHKVRHSPDQTTGFMTVDCFHKRKQPVSNTFIFSDPCSKNQLTATDKISRMRIFQCIGSTALHYLRLCCQPQYSFHTDTRTVRTAGVTVIAVINPLSSILLLLYIFPLLPEFCDTNEYLREPVPFEISDQRNF